MATTELLIHIGTGDARQTYIFDHAKLLNVEAIVIEKKTGLTVAALLFGLAAKSATAVTAAVWVLRKRAEPKLRFEDVVFAIGDCEIEDPDYDEDDELEDDEVVPEAPVAPKAEAPKRKR